MTAAAQSGGGALLAAFLLIVVGQRVMELAVAARNRRRLSVLGAREVSADGFPLLVAVHALFPIALIVEVLVIGAASGPWWPGWLALWLAAQGLRWAAIHALGHRWHVRVIVLPGAPRVTRGPYRLLRHPNYLAVVIELIAAPMLFGAWRTAIAVSMLNAFALARRIRIEEAALAETGVSASS